MAERWRSGEVIVRREVLGLGPDAAPRSLPDWHGQPWLGVPVHVVEDTAEQLVTYIAPGAPFGFVDAAHWPTPDGRHPWHQRDRWTGHGCLMVQRPGDHHAVWHFWSGPEREFTCWYINLQAAFRRTEVGYDTQDLELDLLVFPDGSWEIKDLDLLADRVEEGRFSPDLAQWIVGLGEDLISDIDAGRWWWDPAWAEWRPDPSWTEPRLRSDWHSSPAMTPPPG